MNAPVHHSILCQTYKVTTQSFGGVTSGESCVQIYSRQNVSELTNAINIVGMMGLYSLAYHTLQTEWSRKVQLVWIVILLLSYSPPQSNNHIWISSFHLEKGYLFSWNTTFLGEI
jgi:hypothetical protein